LYDDDTMENVVAKHADALLTSTVRRSGGSLLVTVPASARDALQLAEGQELTVSVEAGRLIFEPAQTTVRRSKYTLDELLSQCDFSQPLSEDERLWLDEPPVGRELL
jgi:antitoxin ChpS